MKLSTPSRMTVYVDQVVFAGHPEYEETVISNEERKNSVSFFSAL